MNDAPLMVLSASEVDRIAHSVQTPDEIARALWDYAFVCWRRGQRFERAHAADAAPRWWGWRRPPGNGGWSPSS